MFKVVLVPSEYLLRGEGLLVRCGGGVPNVWVEECRIFGAAAVQRVVFCDPLNFFLVDDELKAASLPYVSAGFEACRDRCDRSDNFFNWPMFGRSCDSWEGGRSEVGFDHCVDSNSACFHHGERVVGLRNALKSVVTTFNPWDYIDELNRSDD